MSSHLHLSHPKGCQCVTCKPPILPGLFGGPFNVELGEADTPQTRCRVGSRSLQPGALSANLLRGRWAEVERTQGTSRAHDRVTQRETARTVETYHRRPKHRPRSRHRSARHARYFHRNVDEQAGA